MIFIQENAAFLSGIAQSTPQHDKQITDIRLHSSGTFARTLILR